MSRSSSPESVDSYAEQLSTISLVTDGAVLQAIEALPIEPGSAGLDAGCGIGKDTIRLARAAGPGGKVTGLDRSPEFLKLAREAAAQSGIPDRLDFREGDLLALPFDNDAFDWAWCKDCLWPGFVEDPVDGVRELARVVRPGGTVTLAYWSHQSLLPGYPELESRLTEAFTRTTPYLKGVRPNRHHLRALGWLHEAGLVDPEAQGFAACVQGPLDEPMQQAVECTIRMFFDSLESHVSGEDWALYRKLTDRDSNQCLYLNPDYCCLLNYVLFLGRVCPA